MDECTFNKLKTVVEKAVKKENTNMRESISVEKRLSVTLRFLATGESYRSLSYSFRIPPSTLSGIIPQTCRAIYEELKGDYMKLPCTQEQWVQISKDFFHLWNFPNCVGAMDGKHIDFQAPRCSGSYYYNYKGFNSIIFLAVVDARYRFLFVDVGCNGRISDGGVYRNSVLSSLINESLNLPSQHNLPSTTTEVQYVLVADNAFALHEHIMKPYSSKGASNDKKVYNYSLRRARRTVENAFGIFANRFRVLMTKINLPVEKVQSITLVTCALHNFLIKENMGPYLHGVNTEDTDGVSSKEQHLKSVAIHRANRASNTIMQYKSEILCVITLIMKVQYHGNEIAYTI